MELSAEKMLAVNQAEYPNAYSQMPFISPDQAEELTSRREQLLAQLTDNSTCNDTKLATGPLSPGCKTCGQGTWSCLFINGICNGRCFYCPTSQKSKGEPSTNALRFANPKDYLDYIAQFDFKGVSLSGGEPLLTFDRTMNYVKKLKQRFGTTIHLWMYTNGILATEDKIAELAEAGLDEIRFDISADDYTLEKLRLAVKRIPYVTVEIPAIPEDYTRLRDLLPKLVDAGLNHLNLHQLRCTPHNLPHLLARKYVFSHGPKVVLPESELTALQLLLDAKQHGLAVNYCSYAYKYRFQSKAARKRAADILASSYEDVTDAGFVRSLSLKGDSQKLRHCVDILEDSGVESTAYRLEREERLLFKAILWPLLDFSDLELNVAYYRPQIKENGSCQGSQIKVPLNRKRTLLAERVKMDKDRVISTGEQPLFHAAFITGQTTPLEQNGKENSVARLTDPFADVLEYEEIIPGLQPYF